MLSPALLNAFGPDKYSHLFKAERPEFTSLPDDSDSHRRVLGAITSGTEARAWPNPGLYLTHGWWYTRSPWVYMAINLIARSGALVKINAYQMQDETKIALVNHPIEQLIRRPNPWQSQFELIEQTIGFLQVTGNCYWFLYSESGGTPDEIMILRPDRMRVVSGSDHHNLVGGYVYYMEGHMIPIEAEEVIHFKRFHPLSDYYGLSPLEAAMMDVQGEAAMAEYNRNFFSQEQAIPAGVVNIKNPISPLEFERVKAEWRASYGGRNRKTAFLQGSEVEYQDIGLNHREAEFLKGRQFNKELILMLYGVPPSILDKSATQSSATVGMEFLADHTVWPIMQEICQKLTNNLCPFYGENVVVEPEDIRPKDAESERAELQAYGPYLTINEVRGRYLNLPPVGWGDNPATGGGSLLAPSALGLSSGTSPLPKDKQNPQAEGAASGGQGQGDQTPVAKPAAAPAKKPVSLSDGKRTTNREMTRYAKFVLKRLGTDKEGEIERFKFVDSSPAEVLAVKSLTDIQPAWAKWLLDDDSELSDSAADGQRDTFYADKRRTRAALLGFTTLLQHEIKSGEVVNFTNEGMLAEVRHAVDKAANDTIDILCINTGEYAAPDIGKALNMYVARWHRDVIGDFLYDTQRGIKALDGDSEALQYSPLLGLNRARLFAELEATRAYNMGVCIGIAAICDNLGVKSFVNYRDIYEQEAAALFVTPELVYLDDKLIGVKALWHTSTLEPHRHVRGHPLPSREALRVEPFHGDELNGLMEDYARLTGNPVH